MTAEESAKRAVQKMDWAKCPPELALAVCNAMNWWIGGNQAKANVVAIMKLKRRVGQKR